MQSMQLQRAGADPASWSPSSRQYSPMPLPGQKPFGWVGGEGSYLKSPPQQSQKFRISDFINGPTGQQFNQAINDVALNGSQALQNNVNGALGKIGNQNLRNFTQGLADYGFNFANNFVRDGGIQQSWSGLQKGPQYQANYNDVQRGPPAQQNFNDIQQGGQQVEKKKKQGFFKRLWGGVKNIGSKILPGLGGIVSMIPHPAARGVGMGMSAAGGILGQLNK